MGYASPPLRRERGAKELKLRRLDIRPLRLALVTPLVTARERFGERSGLRVSLEDEAGRVGQGEAMPLPAFGTESLEACRAALERVASAVPGLEPADTLEEVEGWLSRLPGLEAAPAARHALESALLDRLGQERGLSLARLLSPSPRTRIEVNALLSSSEPEALGREAGEAARAGFGTLKLKVGTEVLWRDVERLRAVREAVGAAVRIRIDPNGAWSEAAAVAALRALFAFGPELCEQPVAAADFAALARVRRAVPVPLAADEAVPLPGALEALLEGKEGPAQDVLVLKPMVLGGVLRALEIARRAARRGVGAYVTSSIDGPVARAAALHLAAALPEARWAHGLAVGRLFREPDPEALVPRGGILSVPAAPGLGVVF